MRIGFDAKRAFFNNTGLGNYSRDTVNILNHYEKNNQYFLFTPKLIQNERVNFSSNENIKICTPNSIKDKLFSSYWRSYGCIKNLISNNLDLFHGLSNEIPFGIEKTNIKSVVTIHDLIFLRYPKLFNIVDRKIYYKKFKSSCKRANKIIAISKQTKQDIIDFFSINEEKIKVVYQGCNTIFKSKLMQKEKEVIIDKYKLPKSFILYVGTIEERKNLMSLLQAVNKINNINLVVIGNGKSYKKKCLEYIKKNKITSKVFILNNVSFNDMPTIYQSADMMVYPSFFEGFGIPIIEALYSKTPVITTKGGCFEEAGGPDTIYVNSKSVRDLKESIESLYLNEDKREKMKINGFKFAQKFSDDKIANNLFKVYKNI
tara:strand:+ start:366 stop:1484 length:1119 start_codon:yes stop_codon:yes gene_type:complete